MEFRVLGPLEARDGDRELRLRGGKERALLALLLLHANRTLALERIVDELWGVDVPETAQKMVQVYVSHLRKLLPPGTLQTRPPGYALVLEPEQLDLNRFDTALTEARAALDAGEARRAEEGSARRCRSGAGLRSPSSQPSRSHRRKAPVSRTFVCTRSRDGSKPSSRSAATAPQWASSKRSLRSIHCGSVFAPSTCSLSTDPAGMPRRSPAIRHSGGSSPTSSGSSRLLRCVSSSG